MLGKIPEYSNGKVYARSAFLGKPAEVYVRGRVECERPYLHPDMKQIHQDLQKKWSYKMAVVIAVLLVFITIKGEAMQTTQIVDVLRIAQIESNMNPSAVNFKEGSIGICQIRKKGALADYNIHHPQEQHSDHDLFDQDINMKIADWYLNTRIPQMLVRYHKPVTLENILIAYNAGIKYVVENITPPKSTLRYIKKYKGV